MGLASVKTSHRAAGIQRGRGLLKGVNIEISLETSYPVGNSLTLDLFFTIYFTLFPRECITHCVSFTN